MLHVVANWKVHVRCFVCWWFDLQVCLFLFLFSKTLKSSTKYMYIVEQAKMLIRNESTCSTRPSVSFKDPALFFRISASSRWERSACLRHHKVCPLHAPVYLLFLPSLDWHLWAAIQVQCALIQCNAHKPSINTV